MQTKINNFANKNAPIYGCVSKWGVLDGKFPTGVCFVVCFAQFFYLLIHSFGGLFRQSRTSQHFPALLKVALPNAKPYISCHPLWGYSWLTLTSNPKKRYLYPLENQHGTWKCTLGKRRNNRNINPKPPIFGFQPLVPLGTTLSTSKVSVSVSAMPKWSALGARRSNVRDSGMIHALLWWRAGFPWSESATKIWEHVLKTYLSCRLMLQNMMARNDSNHQ